jgi:CspA family cold shock protein
MRELGTVVSYNCSRGGFGFVLADADGARVFVGGTQLARSGIKRLAAGDRISFDILPDQFGGDDRAVNVRVLY